MQDVEGAYCAVWDMTSCSLVGAYCAVWGMTSCSLVGAYCAVWGMTSCSVVGAYCAVWGMKSCSLVGGNGRFAGTCYSYVQSTSLQDQSVSSVRSPQYDLPVQFIQVTVQLYSVFLDLQLPLQYYKYVQCGRHSKIYKIDD